MRERREKQKKNVLGVLVDRLLLVVRAPGLLLDDGHRVFGHLLPERLGIALLVDQPATEKKRKKIFVYFQALPIARGGRLRHSRFHNGDGEHVPKGNVVQQLDLHQREKRKKTKKMRSRGRTPKTRGERGSTAANETHLAQTYW